jgi:hypothetical protein
LDEREIRVGDSLRQTIENGLDESDYVIVALSETALQSRWVQRELNAAFTLEVERGSKIILPVLLEPTDLPLFLRDKKYADFSKSFDKGLEELLRVFDERGTPGTPINIEILKCTVLLDIRRIDGSVVKYTKSQKIRCRKDRATQYIEAFSSDGRLGEFEVEPGKIEEIWEESGTTHVRTLLPSPINENEVIDRTFRCTWYDSFLQDSEYWDQRQHHPSKNVEILVRFPKGRPPTRWETYLKEGAIKMPCEWQAKLITSAGKPTLHVELPSPRLLYSYVLRWDW